MGNKGPSDVYPILALPYGIVHFPGKTLHLSPANREDVATIIAKYYQGSLKTKNKDNAPVVACVPLRSPYLSPDGKKLIEAAEGDQGQRTEPDVHNMNKDDLFNFGCLAKITGIRGGKRGEVALVLEGVARCKLDKITQETPYFAGRVVEYKDVVDVWDPALKGKFAHLKELSKELFQLVRMSSMVSRNSSMPPLLIRQLEAFVARKDISDSGFLADFMAVLGQCSYEDKLWLLSATSVLARMDRANDLVQKQISTLQSSTKIITLTNTSKEGIDPDRLRQLQQEAMARRGKGIPSGFSGGIPSMPGGGAKGGDDEEENEVQELKKRLDEAGLSEEAQKVANRELKRMTKMNPAQAEYSVVRNYLENLSEIPWTKATEDKLDISTLARARQQLDDDHYGLETVKKRLLEYLAVLKLKQQANSRIDDQIKVITDKATAEQQDKEESDSAEADADDEAKAVVQNKPAPALINSPELNALRKKRKIDKSPILLLVGPPGVGKTSLAKSVASALGRKFHRISLGGVRDEAEIRGHRRTYVAAMPGLIVSGLKKVGVANPVFLLDEIDKVSSANHHGDPSAAMLEVLDPEQNHSFNDHYVNIPIDLSKVLFIATANTLETIAPPLLDRMETIQLSGYTTIEKRHIATRHLLPKQVTTNGLVSGDIDIPGDVLEKIITAYTRESGVRNLEREIGSVIRYKAVQYSEAQDSITSEAYSPHVKVEELEDILGIERFTDEIAGSSPPRPGIVTGLVAFSGLGQGSILFIEIADMPGNGRVQLTGKLGDVLKESVEVALTWVKSHAFALDITNDPTVDVMKDRSIHVHCPAGAIPKDGPSAGLAHTIALISLFRGLSVPPTLAMTGEVSLRGKVTPVGGIKEKLIGALRAGVKTVMLPVGNRKDAKELPQEVLEGMNILFVEHIWEALRIVWPEERWGEGWELDARL
ncbi:hypothetical protein FH972_026082 [Carpinus fangiana]|uniref:Lon protease homolog 2, peroxisomal n=1 Tax=Carpinus fangiana TaxID=176857 RepID=A0A5N6L2W6_9ROSI|nr:hypothetical protein FH972_026082 [Carpinus fangiana]